MHNGYPAYYLVSIILISAVFTPACDKSIFFSENHGHSLFFETERFDTVVINDIFEIELRSDTLYAIRIEGSKQSINNIDVRTVNNTLVAEDNNRFKWLPDYPAARVIISFPALRRMVLNTPSTVFSSDTLYLENFSIYSLGQTARIDLTINAGNFRFVTEMDNFGHYTFRGYSRYAGLWHRGSSLLFAGDLETEFMHITNNSTGDCYVHAHRRLTAIINHYGNVYYRGFPEEILKEISSRGKLIRYAE